MKLLSVVLASVLAAASASPALAQAPAPSKPKVKAAARPQASAEELRAMLQRHLGAFVANNLDALLADYTGESVLVAPWGTYRGTTEIRKFFAELMPSFPTPDSKLELDKVEVVDSMVYFTWHALTPKVKVPFATDTMVVKDGKILRQTFGGLIEQRKD